MNQKLNAEWEIQVRKINFSSPTLMKSRCKKCGKHPNLYYCIRQSDNIFNPRDKIKQSEWLFSFFKRMSSNWHLSSSPKWFTKLDTFSHIPSYKSFTPRLHKTKSSVNANYIEYLSCGCYGSIWAFSDMGNQLPEHRNRRSRRQYPNTFIY